MVMFDLPTETKEDRRNYTQFRKKLLENGFWQIQYSVYARPCFTDETAETYEQRIKRWLPPLGQVRILMFTDKQFGRQKVFYSKKVIDPEKPPDQLTFF